MVVQAVRFSDLYEVMKSFYDKVRDTRQNQVNYCHKLTKGGKESKSEKKNWGGGGGGGGGGGAGGGRGVSECA